jgi:hypothetical protein
VLSEVTAALARRDLATAQQRLIQAQRAAGTSQQRHEVQRLWLVWHQLSRFWTAVSDAVPKLRVGDTLVYRGVQVTVEGMKDGSVSLRAPNGDQKSFPLDRARVDAELAVALVERELAAAGPVAWSVCGAFLAVDQEGDAARAHQFLELARRQGIPVEALYAELATDRHSATARRHSQRHSQKGTVARDQATASPAKSGEPLVAMLLRQPWTIHWDNQRQWPLVRFLPDRQWGYNNSLAGPWMLEGDAVVASFARNPQQRLTFRLDQRELRVAYVIDGQLRHHGVVKPGSGD